MPMQPSPRADTSRLLLPNLRFCIVSPFCCFGPNHLVSNPDRITFALLTGFEPEGNGCVSGRARTVQNGRIALVSVAPRANHQAHLIDELDREERPVDAA